VSLRARLLAIMLVLVAAGLAVAGWATYAALRSSLIDRVDDQLRSIEGPARRQLTDAGPRADDRLPPGIPVGTVGQLRDREGSVIATFVARLDGSPSASLRPPGTIPSGTFEVDLPSAGAYRFTSVPADAVAPPGPTGIAAGDTLIVGIPLSDVEATLSRLVWIEVAVGASVLAALGLLAFWLVRVALRPLTRIEQTAGAIAAGDFSRRVEESNPRTEVGRLGRALNAMLAAIEAAFAERRAAEGRLRRFLADASHELQTPLTSVRGYAELFRRGAAERPADLANAMRRIESEATRMSLLVDDMLLLARLDEGRPMAREPVDLGVLARDLVGDARAVEPDRPIALDVAGATEVIGDEMRLRQVLTNLLANARVHTPPRTRVWVRVAPSGDDVAVEVRDEGPGIPPDDLERIFERFFRSDPSRARASGGNGLGLSIVAAIAAAHGGRAEAESGEGRGATFRVLLPRARVPPPASAAESPHPSDAAPRPAQS